MERAHVRTRQLPPFQRSFERSRLEEQLLATAYELALPVHRQSLPAGQRTARREQPSTHKGGLSA